MVSCQSSGDDNDLDHILGGPVSDELVTVVMTESPQQPGCLQNLLGVLPAPTNDAGRMAELPLCEGRTGNCREEVLAKGLVYLSLMCYLCHTHALLVM